MANDLNSQLQLGAAMGYGIGDLNMLAAQSQGMPRINPERVMDSMIVRRAIRQGMSGPGVTPRGGRIARAMSGVSEGMPPLGGGMDPSSVVDPSVANNALAPYGLQLPTHTNPFLFFNDQNQDGSTTWAGNHPKVARAIEGAMIGATTQGGATVGENISNVAKSVLGIPGLYKQSQAAQMEAPFDQARQINALQMDQINMHEKLAQAYHLYATGQAALDKPPKPPHYQLYVDPKGKSFGYNQETNTFESPGGNVPDTPEKLGTYGKQSGKYPTSIKSQSERMGYDAYVAAGGKTNDDGSPADIKGYQRYVYASQGASAAAQGGAGTSARKSAGQAAGDVSQVDDKALAAMKSDAEAKERTAAKKPDLAQFADAPDPVKARNAAWEQSRNEAKAARAKYNDAVSQMNQAQPNSRIKGGGKPPVVIHPDGRVEIGGR